MASAAGDSKTGPRTYCEGSHAAPRANSEYLDDVFARHSASHEQRAPPAVLQDRVVTVSLESSRSKREECSSSHGRPSFRSRKDVSDTGQPRGKGV
jgi:hypothetical protein